MRESSMIWPMGPVLGKLMQEVPGLVPVIRNKEEQGLAALAAGKLDFVILPTDHRASLAQANPVWCGRPLRGVTGWSACCGRSPGAGRALGSDAYPELAPPSPSATTSWLTPSSRQSLAQLQGAPADRRHPAGFWQRRGPAAARAISSSPPSGWARAGRAEAGEPPRPVRLRRRHPGQPGLVWPRGGSCPALVPPAGSCSWPGSWAPMMFRRQTGRIRGFLV